MPSTPMLIATNKVQVDTCLLGSQVFREVSRVVYKAMYGKVLSWWTTTFHLLQPIGSYFVILNYWFLELVDS